MARSTALACVYFVAVMLAMPLIQGSDYSAGADSISEGALGRLGWLQVSAFIVLGVASLMLAVALRGAWTGISGALAPVLIAVWGVAVILCGIFPVDAGARGETTAAAIHLWSALIAFAALLAAMWFASFAFRTNPVWERWSKASILTSIVATVAFFVVGAAPQEADWGGYAQRAFVLIVVAWLASVSLVAA